MSKTLNVTKTMRLDSTSYQTQVALTTNNAAESEPVAEISAATSGTLTTRTDANTGVVTLSGGHGLTNGTGDVFWDGGSRRGMTWTIATNALTIDGGSGDDLPAVSTAVTVKKPQSFDLVVADGDAAGWAYVYAALGPNDGNAYVAFLDALAADVKVYTLSGELPANSWDGPDVATNPFAGADVATVTYSHGNTSSLLMGAAIGYD